jgi:peroxiredoxin family protein
MATSMMKKEIANLDFPEIEEFIEIISDSGGKMYACRMSVDMFKDMHLMAEEDIHEAVEAVVGATDFMEMSEDAQIIFI